MFHNTRQELEKVIENITFLKNNVYKNTLLIQYDVNMMDTDIISELKYLNKYLILINFIDDTQTKVNITKHNKKTDTYKLVLKRNKKQITFYYSLPKDQEPDLLHMFRHFLILFPVDYNQFKVAFEIENQEIYDNCYSSYLKLSKLYSDDELYILHKL